MKEQTHNLRKYISITLAAVTLVMVVAYSLLVNFALESTLLDMATYDLRIDIRDFTKDYVEDPQTPLPARKNLVSTMEKDQLPSYFVQETPPEEMISEKLYYGLTTSPDIYEGEPFYFLGTSKLQHDGKTLYLIQTYLEKENIPGTFKNWRRTIGLTLFLGVSFILLMGLILIYFFTKVSQKINSLSQWANELTPQKLKEEHPNFHFTEINQIADFIQSSANDLQEALDREHQFLRHASHELRTPIAVIRSNIDLLDRLKMDATSDKHLKSYDRIRRSAQNMQHLTETLLWLSRKDENMPEPEAFELGNLVQDVVDEQRYLIEGKSVSIKMDLEPANLTLKMPKTAFRIIVSNLVRNAFQYTPEGLIRISAAQNSFEIRNQIKKTDDRKDPKTFEEYGFGLGLTLVEQTSLKLNLKFETHSDETGFRSLLWL